MFKRKVKVNKEYVKEPQKSNEDKYEAKIKELERAVEKLMLREALRIYLDDIKKLPDVTEEKWNVTSPGISLYFYGHGQSVPLDLYTEEYFGPRIFVNGMGFVFEPVENDAKNKRFTYKSEAYVSREKVVDNGSCRRNVLWEPLMAPEGFKL